MMDGWAWPVGPSLAYRQDFFFFFFVHGWAWTVGDSITYKQAFVHGWDRMVRYIKTELLRSWMSLLPSCRWIYKCMYVCMYEWMNGWMNSISFKSYIYFGM
jgi:hypothetical protein